MRQFLLAVAVAVSASSLAPAAPAKPGLQAGAATSNITPLLGGDIIGGFVPFPSTNVHDELHARCLVLDDGRPAIIDFQLAVRGDPRSRWMRLLAREDLRHLLKHKRMYCRAALTPVEKRVLGRTSWLRDLWFRTGKPVYRVVTRKILKWEDNEGQGPKP